MGFMASFEVLEIKLQWVFAIINLNALGRRFRSFRPHNEVSSFVIVQFQCCCRARSPSHHWNDLIRKPLGFSTMHPTFRPYFQLVYNIFTYHIFISLYFDFKFSCGFCRPFFISMALYRVHYTQCAIHCTLYIVQTTQCTVHYAQHTINSAPYTIHCTE